MHKQIRKHGGARWAGGWGRLPCGLARGVGHQVEPEGPSRRQGIATECAPTEGIPSGLRSFLSVAGVLEVRACLVFVPQRVAN